MIGDVVIRQLALPFLRHQPKDAEMPIGHDPSQAQLSGVRVAVAIANRLSALLIKTNRPESEKS